MSDIVERLSNKDPRGDICGYCNNAQEAVAEIIRLRAERDLAKRFAAQLLRSADFPGKANATYEDAGGAKHIFLCPDIPRLAKAWCRRHLMERFTPSYIVNGREVATPEEAIGLLMQEPPIVDGSSEPLTAPPART